MFLSEILILSPDGACLISKKFRQDVKRKSVEAFQSRMRDYRLTDCSPHFVVDDLYCFYIHRKMLYFCATSTAVISPLLVVETLTRFYHLVKDFCGSVTEESIRANFVLIHELLNEFMDCGYLQLSAAEKLKPYIQSEPAILRNPENQAVGLFGLEFRTAPGNAADRPVIRPRLEQDQRKNEIFMDIIERLTVAVAANGSVLRSELHGQVNMKCFLDSCPQVKIGFNKDLVIGAGEQQLKSYGNATRLDSCTFHNSVNLDEFAEQRVISILPPEGEFSVMTYHVEGDLPQGLPFRIYSYIKDNTSSRDVELSLRLRCELPANCQAINVTVLISVPSTTISISQQLNGAPGQSAHLITSQKKIEWRLSKVVSRSEQLANFKLIGAKESKSCHLEIGPVVLNFEISGYVCSNLQVHFLRVFDRERSYVPMKWIRYITTADSYVVKLK